MRLSEVMAAMEVIAPTGSAEPWDNVGLLVGEASQDVSRAMLTIDYTPAVAREAAEEGCDLIIAYHPPIFDPIKRLTGGLIFDAIRHEVAIYSPHTALDVADGGTNDMLADVIGLTRREPLRLAPAKSSDLRLITFLPPEHADRVAGALFAAGAGKIGNYSQCSFRGEGVGTFFGEAGTKPGIGKSERLERVSEIKLETIVPIERLNDLVTALRASHPYETPAFDLIPLVAPPSLSGQGRIGILPPTERSVLIDRIKQELGTSELLIAGPKDGVITRAACCAGACGDMLNDAITGGAELYLTGEMRHHDALRAAAAEMTVICTLHSNSERSVLKRVAGRLVAALPSLDVKISREDRDPFEIA